MPDASIPSAHMTDPQAIADVAHAAAQASAPAWLAQDLLVILGTAALVATVFARLRLEAIPGFLIAGALVGPGALGLVGDSPRIEQIADLAVILLMFGIGLQLDMSTIKRGMANILAIGVTSTLLVVLILWLVGMLAGLSPPVALVLAMAFSMSSTAIFVRILQARRELRAVHGRVGLGVSIVQDLSAVLVLALLPPIARWAGGSPVGVAHAHGSSGLASFFESLPAVLEVLARGLVGVGGVVLMVLLGRYVLPRILGAVARAGSGELVLITSGAIAFAAALGTRTLGFSAEMGAFLAGFLLASTPYRYQLSGQLAPIRDLLMAVFFTAVGLKVDLGTILGEWWVVLGGVAAVVLVKAAAIGVCSWALGMTAPGAAIAGILLANAGEFSLVVLGGAFAAGAIDDRVMGDAIAIVIASLVLSPFLAAPARRLAERITRVGPPPWLKQAILVDPPAAPGANDTTSPADAAASSPASTPGSSEGSPSASLEGTSAAEPTPAPSIRPAMPPHVIIAGFGPVARAIADRLAILNVPFAVVELNPTTVQRQAVLGREVIYGDITNPEVLDRAGLSRATAVVLTIPDDQAVFRAIKAIRAAAPNVFIAARTSFLSGKFVAMQLGADVVTVEEVATALAMEREVLGSLLRSSAPTDVQA